MMEFIRTIREKQQVSQHKSIIEQAHNSVCLDDFDNEMYIAYNGVPLIPIESTWTPKEILKKLEDTRNSFIKYKQNQLNIHRASAVL